ncbi:hypothetical protein C900_04947 [Fulvivirga imtechensis AK7]|uniref:Uncharacterized protein n=1 Tax=Fulvivirga imtechensis AK7 TaxID=1237149 RepID=L8JKU4_9BACT|nr:hypothetical protein C900_04947 [Fulvivirga imtechensis AK7]
MVAQPTASLSADFGGHNNSTITVSATFSEVVTGLESSDFQVNNGSADHLDSIIAFNHLTTIGVHGNEQGNFSNPRGLDVDQDGKIYVSDQENDRIQVFDSNYDFLFDFGGSGAGEGQFNRPQGIDIRNDSIFIADTQNHRVQVFNTAGEYIYSFGEGDLIYPKSISVNEYYIYVADSDHRLRIFSKSGDLVRAVRPTLSSWYPVSNTSAEVSTWNDMVAVVYNYTITKYGWLDVNMHSVYLYDQHADLLEILYSDNYVPPKSGIDFDDSGNIYLVFSNKFLKLDLQGSVLNNRNFNVISNARDISIDKNGNAYIADYDGHNVEVLGKQIIYIAEISPVPDATVSIQVPQDVVFNSSMEGNLASNELVFEYDGIAPTVNLTTSATNPTDQYPIIIDVVFSETVHNFTIEDVSVEPASYLLNISGSGDTYQLEVWPNGNNSYAISIPENTVTDDATNGNSASNTIYTTFEASIPVAVVSNLGYTPGGDSLLVDIQFSEPVTNVNKGSFEGENYFPVSLENTPADTLEHLQLKLRPTSGETVVNFYLRRNAAYSLARNPMPESNHIEVVYDIIPPSVNLITQSAFFNNDTITVTAQWREVVSDFTEEDILISGGAELVGFETTDGQEYHLSLKALYEGEIIVSVPENAAMDMAGTRNPEADSIVLVYDVTPPTAELVFTDKLYTSPNVNVDILLSEPVVLNSGNINLNLEGASLASLTGRGTMYSAILNITLDEGIAYASFPQNSFYDAAGNGNISSNKLKIRFDPTPLTVDISSEQEQYIYLEEVTEIVALFSFSEPVQSFSEKHVQVYGAAGHSVTKLSETSYELTVVLPSYPETLVELYLLENSVLNESGLGNPYAEYFFLVDKSPPTVELVSSSGSEINGVTSINIYLDDPVFNFQTDPISCLALDALCFTETDIDIAGGKVSNFTGNYDHFTFDLIPIEKDIVLQVPADVAFNIMDVGNIASNVLRLKYASGVVIVGNEKSKKQENIIYWIDQSNFLNVNLLQQKSKSEIRILEVSGKQILKTLSNKQVWQEDISYLSDGIYLLLVQTDDQLFKSRFIISK